MKQKVEWKSRHKDGQYFPVIPRGYKKNLPTTLKLQAIPEDSHLHDDMKKVELKYSRKEHSEEPTEKEELRHYTGADLVALGIKELSDRGLEIGRDYHITENEGFTVGTKVKLRQKGTSSFGASKYSKYEEMGWMPESVRRAKAQKMTRAISSGLKAPHD